MKNYIKILFAVLFSLSSYAQITFNGANPLLENQDYSFTLESVDATGRNIYTTAPIDGNQSCGGIGICELKLAWNDTESQWEMLADDGNGGFSSTYVLFTNSEAATPNPPSLDLGNWIENTDETQGKAGGDLKNDNTTMQGDVQSTVLSSSNVINDQAFNIYPNPAYSIINVDGNKTIDNLSIYNLKGQLLIGKSSDLKTINVSKLSKGMYFLKITSGNAIISKKVMIFN